MALPQAPDIPMPRLNDEEYMDLWRKYLQASQENYYLEMERNTWRRAFYGICATLFSITVALIVIAGIKILEQNF
jgi:hypothetical protein